MSLSRFDRSDISESVPELRRREREYASHPRKDRIRALRMLKEDNALTLRQVGERVGRSERGIQRWLELYRSGGIPNLLDPPMRRGRPKKLGGEIVAELQTKMENGNGLRIAEFRRYLQETHGLSLTRSGLWYILKRDFSAVLGGWVTIQDTVDRASRTTINGSDRIERFLDFLNSLPVSGSAAARITAFKNALASFLGDVDRITVQVDLNFDLENPEDYRVAERVVEHIPSKSARSRISMVDSGSSDGTPSQRLVRESSRNGLLQLQDYYEPACFDYPYGGAHLGSLILWRNRDQSPISAETVSFVERIEQFVRYAMADIIAHNRAIRPIDAAFADALKRLTVDAKLTGQQRRIVILQLMGYQQKEMADILSIGVDAIKKHINQIYKKTGTHSQPELFAKYFSFKLAEEGKNPES